MARRKKKPARRGATANADLEMRWVDAWNDLAAIVGDARDKPCLLPDGCVVTVEECEAWLQNSAYEGYTVQVEAGWVGHRRGVIASRRADAGI